MFTSHESGVYRDVEQLKEWLLHDKIGAVAGAVLSPDHSYRGHTSSYEVVTPL